MAPKLEEVMESSLYVSNLERAVAFYKDVLGLRVSNDEYFADGRGAAFLVGPTVLLIFQAAVTLKGGMLPAHGTSGAGHVAFRVAPRELAAWRKHLVACGVEIEKEFSFSGQPPSIYFRDPDGNSLEFAVASIWPFEKS